MLKSIHQKPLAPRASSIYCRWILDSTAEGARLVAVWMDSDMRCFENEFAPKWGSSLPQHEALEEPGGRSFFVPLRRSSIFGIPTRHQ